MFKLAQIVTGYHPGKGPSWHGSAWDLNTTGGAQPPLYTPFEAEVINVNRPSGYGNTVWLRDPATGEIHQFSHLKSTNVAKGQKLKPGDYFGDVGYDGLSHKGSHLHWGAYKGDVLAALEAAKFEPGFKGAFNSYQIDKGKDLGYSFFNKSLANNVQTGVKNVKTISPNSKSFSSYFPDFIKNVLDGFQKSPSKNLAQEAGFKVIGSKLKLI